MSKLGHRLARRKLFQELGLWHSSSGPVSKGLDTGCAPRKSLLGQVLRSWRSSGVPVSKEDGVALDFDIGFRSWSPENVCMGAVLASAFNNGWIMILLEQMVAHSQSAADQFVSNGQKTDHNSLVGKELGW